MVVSRWKALAVLALVVGASIGASLLAVAVADRAATDKAAAVREDARHNLEVVALRSARINREADVAQCERVKADRRDAIRGWATARDARLKTARNPQVPQGERFAATTAAAVYGEVIKSLKSRLVNCSKKFPPVSVSDVKRRLGVQET